MTDWDVSMLEGQRCRLWLYVRGYLPRDMLAHAWHLVESEQAASRLFHGQVVDDTPISTRGDLVQFVRYFDTPERILFIVQEKVSQDLVGLIWFDAIMPNYRAFANVFFRRAAYGALATEAGEMALRYAFDHEGWEHVWASTPWPEAASYAKRLGFLPQATLPNIERLQGKEHTLYMSRLSVFDYRKRLTPVREGA